MLYLVVMNQGTVYSMPILAVGDMGGEFAAILAVGDSRINIDLFVYHLYTTNAV